MQIFYFIYLLLLFIFLFFIGIFVEYHRLNIWLCQQEVNEVIILIKL